MHFQNNANEYARAIYEIASEKKMTEIFYDQFLLLQKTFLQYHDFYQIFTNLSCDKNIKKDMVKNIYTNVIDSDILNFLLYLIDQKETSIISSIITKTIKFLEKELNVLNVRIFTPFELNNEQIHRITEKISNTKKQIPVATVIIDPNLIGGIRLQYDSKLLDNSISTKLNTIRQNIKRGK
ncbi:MAG: ATP synthase F1 subunit delta [Mycoplasma sp.]